MKETQKIENQFKTTLTTLCYNFAETHSALRTILDPIATPLNTNFQRETTPEKDIITLMCAKINRHLLAGAILQSV